jgi:Zn finger protein HypA/HybF involved in hydrogenase expression
MNMQTLLQRDTEYNARLKVQGMKMFSYKCPLCDGDLETRAAPKSQVWDTAAQCPHCEGVYVKITTDKGVKSLPMPE